MKFHSLIMHISQSWIQGVLQNVVHLENTFLSVFGDSGYHCAYVCCYDGIFPFHNIYTYFHPSLNKHFTYKYLIEQVIHVLTSVS
jgi:hypothetical protein